MVSARAFVFQLSPNIPDKSEAFPSIYAVMFHEYCTHIQA
jgi:hypothetical protein